MKKHRRELHGPQVLMDKKKTFEIVIRSHPELRNDLDEIVKEVEDLTMLHCCFGDDDEVVKETQKRLLGEVLQRRAVALDHPKMDSNPYEPF